MADNKVKTMKETPASPTGRPESPTTAQPLDFDDDVDAATPTKSPAVENAPKPPPKDETPPAKPPRPLSPRQQAENTLKEAFPSIDAQVVRAVLAASGGQVEPAFNALLGMSDPDAVREPELEPEQEPAPPARPPRPVQQATTHQSQLEADELFARQLQEHYANTERAQQYGRPQDVNQPQQAARSNQTRAQGGTPNPEDRSEWQSFLNEDLPEIKENIRKGFLDTQQTVNRWISTFKKTIDGEENDDPRQRQTQSGTDAGGQAYGRRSNENRRSADLARYDADPQVIGDDFSKLDLRDNEHPPRTSSRPPANPNLFKGEGDGARRKSVGRKVSFQDGPPEEIQDMYSSNTQKTATTTIDTGKNGNAGTAAAAKSSKWQPLAKADPSPVAEHDPFSLGDSDDERDAKPIQMHDDTKDDEESRLAKAMDEAANDTIGKEGTTTNKTDVKK